MRMRARGQGKRASRRGMHRQRSALSLPNLPAWTDIGSATGVGAPTRVGAASTEDGTSRSGGRGNRLPEEDPLLPSPALRRALLAASLSVAALAAAPAANAGVLVSSAPSCEL